MNYWFLTALFLGSLVISAVAVEWSIRYANSHGVFDEPDGKRKLQAVPIPKLGGLAVAVAFAGSALAVIVLRPMVGREIDAVSILVGGVLAAILGFLDDRKPLSPRVRLLSQTGIALLLWVGGSRVEVTPWQWLNMAITVLWILMIVNGINLLDNADGLASATTYVAAAGAALVALIYGQYWITPFAVAVCGVALGFVLHNWFPARVYLGDAGAYFLGVLLAVLVIRLRPAGVSDAAGVVIAVGLVLLPLIDTTFVVVRRLMRGVHPFTAGRDHLSHEVQRRGLSVPASVLSLQVVGLLGVAAAVLVAASVNVV